MPDQRVISRSSARVRESGRTAQASPVPEEPAKGSRRTTVVLVVLGVLVVVLAAATAVVMLGLGTSDDTEADSTAQSSAPSAAAPGEVVEVEPVSVNLQDNHYLRVGFSMQMGESASSDVSVARAQDVAIDLFSGQTMAGVNAEGARNDLKEQLLERLSDAYEGQVIDVYLTSFVTQ